MRKQEENTFKPIPNKRYVDEESEHQTARRYLACMKITTSDVVDPFGDDAEKYNIAVSGQMGAGKSFCIDGGKH